MYHVLEKEKQIMKLDHANIVALLAIIFEHGHYGVVMEYMLHGSLDDYICVHYVCCFVSGMFKCLYSFMLNT